MAFLSSGKIKPVTREDALAYCGQNPPAERMPGQRLRHRWATSTMWALRFMGVPPEVAMEVIAERMGRKPQPRELEDLVAEAYYGLGRGGSGPSRPRPNPYSEEAMLSRAGRISGEITHDMLAELSPECVIDVRAGQYLETVFPFEGARVPIVHAVGTTPDGKPIWPIGSQQLTPAQR